MCYACNKNVGKRSFDNQLLRTCQWIREITQKFRRRFIKTLSNMRLSVVCFFKRTVPGHIFRGKYRLVRQVTKADMAAQVKEYERQDKIMHLLRYPYLTPVSKFFLFFVLCNFFWEL